MKSNLVEISKLIENENNPRIIRSEKFEKLVKSIKDFPEMLELRPIVVNKDMVIIGGNMRYNACLEAGIKKVPVVVAHLTPEQEKEFIIKDNASAGEWDYSELKSNWADISLGEWGVDNWDLQQINFEPTFNPSSKVSDVTKADIDKESQKLENQFSAKVIEKRTVICPHCLEDFEIEG